MAAATYNLYIEQGATFRFSLVAGYKTGAKDPQGNDIVEPYDLTGCSARMQIRQRRGGEVLVAATTLNGGIVFEDAVNGKMSVCITDEATDKLTMSKAKYDLEIGYPSGDVKRILEGLVKISANITQDVLADDGTITDEEDVSEDELVNNQAG